MTRGHRNEGPTSVYWIYDAEEKLLYIGISNGPLARMLGHAGTKAWWAQAATIRLHHYPTRGAALDAEGAAIDEHRPPYNLAGPRGPYRTPTSPVVRPMTFRLAAFGFGRSVLRVRSHQQIYRADLAKKAGIATGRLGVIELGRVRAREDEEERIAAALGVKVDELYELADWDYKAYQAWRIRDDQEQAARRRKDAEADSNSTGTGQ